MSDNVKEFKKKPGRPKKETKVAPPQAVAPEAVDPRAGMTQEEIEEFMRLEEEMLDSHIAKYAMVMPQIDHSGVSEEDEDEELFTVDLENNVVTQHLGEGVAVRDADGTITVVEDEDVAAKIKEVITAPSPKVEVIETIETPVKEKPVLETRYENLIRDTFVSKAVRSLIEKLIATEDAMAKATHVRRMDVMNGMLEKEVTDMMYKKRIELRKAISGGIVRYDAIPKWAEAYIEEYIQEAIGGLTQLTERD